MSAKIMSNDDLVIHDNTVFGFSLNTLIGNNSVMKGLKDLSVPAGLFLTNSSRHTSSYADFTKKGEVISDALYESLVSAAEPKMDSKNIKFFFKLDSSKW